MTPEEKKEYFRRWREEHKDYHKEYFKSYKPPTPEEKAMKKKKRQDRDDKLELEKLEKLAHKKALDAEKEEKLKIAKAKKDMFDKVEFKNGCYILKHSIAYDRLLDYDEVDELMVKEEKIRKKLKNIITDQNFIYIVEDISHHGYTTIDRELYLKSNNQSEMQFFFNLSCEVIDTILSKI